MDVHYNPQIASFSCMPPPNKIYNSWFITDIRMSCVHNITKPMGGCSLSKRTGHAQTKTTSKLVVFGASFFSYAKYILPDSGPKRFTHMLLTCWTCSLVPRGSLPTAPRISKYENPRKLVASLIKKYTFCGLILLDNRNVLRVWYHARVNPSPTTSKNAYKITIKPQYCMQRGGQEVLNFVQLDVTMH